MPVHLAILGGPRALSEDMSAEWPPITDMDENFVLSSLRGNNHSYGPNCRAFEEEFAKWNGNRHAINTNSGTAALHMCIAAVGCGVGDEVIVPAYSWSSSATAVLHHDAIPVFVDIEWDTMNIDVSQIEAAITDKTKAILVVHLHGLSVDMVQVRQIADRHGLYVIEDACQSHGACFNGNKVGTWGDCAAFSFNQNKTLCAGDAGMFVTNNNDLLLRARQLWSFGENSPPSQSRDYHAYALGWMYRSNDLTAAFGRAQLQQIDSYIDRQRSNANRLTQCLTDTPGLYLPTESEGSLHTFSSYTVRLDTQAVGWTGDPIILRDAVVDAISAEGIPNGLGVWQRFILPEMTVFQAKNAYGKGHPWSHPAARPIEYIPENYPVAIKHCHAAFGINTPLRTADAGISAEHVAVAITKVMRNIDELIASLIKETPL